jgi:hypothetical protein
MHAPLGLAALRRLIRWHYRHKINALVYLAIMD